MVWSTRRQVSFCADLGREAGVVGEHGASTNTNPAQVGVLLDATVLVQPMSTI